MIWVDTQLQSDLHMSTVVTVFPVSWAFQFPYPGRGIPAMSMLTAVMAKVRVGIVRLAVFKLCVFGISVLNESCIGPLSLEEATS